MTRPGDARDMPDPDPLTVPGTWLTDEYAEATNAAMNYGDGYRAGFDDATEARGGTRLAGCLVVMAAVAILCAISFTAGRVTAATPRGAQDSTFPVVAPALLGAPHVDARPSASSRPIGGGGAPTPHNANALVRTGIASNMGPGYPASYLALPDGPGWTVRVCGPADCLVRTSTDAGPSLAMQRVGRVADLSVADFERVSGQRWTMGLVNVSVTVLRVPR